VRDWIPSPEDVGAEIRSRTVDGTGDETGTFNLTTRPTVDEIGPLIDAVISRITRLCGQIPDDLMPDARRTAALGTALKIERTYYPEQINSGRSPYPQMKIEYDEELKELITAVQDNDNDPTTGDIEPLATSYFGPDYSVIGMTTQW
jgi:hypothetical protein